MPDPLPERVQREGTPIVEGDTATLVWRGRQAPPLIGDFTDWEVPREPLWRRVAPALWAYTVTLPRDAYLEYAFGREKERVPDPFNPRTVPDGLGQINHFFYMPEGGPTPLIQRKRSLQPGARRPLRLQRALLGGRLSHHRFSPGGGSLRTPRSVGHFPAGRAAPVPVLRPLRDRARSSGAGPRSVGRMRVERIHPPSDSVPAEPKGG